MHAIQYICTYIEHTHAHNTYTCHTHTCCTYNSPRIEHIHTHTHLTSHVDKSYATDDNYTQCFADIASTWSHPSHVEVSCDHHPTHVF